MIKALTGDKKCLMKKSKTYIIRTFKTDEKQNNTSINP